MGSENLTKPDIQELIQKRLVEMQMNTDEILKLLTDIARASPEIFMTFTEGTWSIDIPKAQKAAKLHLIKSIKMTRYGYVIEMHDPLKALEMLGRARNLFNDNLKVSVPLAITGLDAILDKVYGDGGSPTG